MNYPKGRWGDVGIFRLIGWKSLPNQDLIADFGYFKSADLDKAQEEYENLIALTTGRMWWGDLYVKSFYMLGKIYEKQGNKAKALEHYKKFLDLWKDADPGLPEVEDVKMRVAGLQSQ